VVDFPAGVLEGRCHRRRPGLDAPGAVEQPDREPPDSDSEGDESEVQCRLGHEGAKRDRDRADGVQHERGSGDLTASHHGGDEGEGAEREGDRCHRQGNTQRAGSECVNGALGEITGDEVDDELDADQRRQGEGVEQVGDQPEGSGAAPKGEVEGGDERQRQDLRERGHQLGERRGRDDLGTLGGIDEQYGGASGAGYRGDAVEGRMDGVGHGSSEEFDG